MGLIKAIFHEWIYVLVLCISLVASGLWIIVAARNHSLGDAGRGGAIAVAFSFIALSVRRDFGALASQTHTKLIPAIEEKIARLSDNPESTPIRDIDNLKREIDGIKISLRVDARSQAIQNVVLALSSAIGTLAWGFGDVISQALINHHQ